jgi:hypothetical protein
LKKKEKTDCVTKPKKSKNDDLHVIIQIQKKNHIQGMINQLEQRKQGGETIYICMINQIGQNTWIKTYQENIN